MTFAIVTVTGIVDVFLFSVTVIVAVVTVDTTAISTPCHRH